MLYTFAVDLAIWQFDNLIGYDRDHVKVDFQNDFHNVDVFFFTKKNK